MVSGREPIRWNFHVTGGQKQALHAVTRGKKKKAESEGGNGESEGSSDGRSEGGSDGNGRGMDGKGMEGRGTEGRGSPGGSVGVENGSGRRGRGPGGSSPDPWPALGRAWPQQVCGAGLTKIKRWGRKKTIQD
ncbi:hypothetical protein NDU88_007293 [Pleurodeles waltl]|uniref:Uncharacterized protein n=1 Tax=Pleurodeles waltl TaxID=8319 RepID=A0AAV7N1P5_PLEWA|nr:hypothetical protein NDU88_007293 [Pleurodeles waltl]